MLSIVIKACTHTMVNGDIWEGKSENVIIAYMFPYNGKISLLPLTHHP